MFRTKTVFVLGAGASDEVGLPTGDHLKKKIAQKLDIQFKDGYRQDSGDYHITEALRSHVKLPDGRQGNINPYLERAHQIREALPLNISIDNFLDNHRGDEHSRYVGNWGL